MNCKEFENKIVSYMDGFLDDDIRSTMDEHRTSCPECARLAQAHSFIMKSLDTAEPVKAPLSLADRILAQVAAEEQSAAFEKAAPDIGLTDRRQATIFDCETFEEHIAAYADCLLEGNLLAAMNDHRAACSACDRKAHAQEYVFSSLNNAEPVKAPAGLYNRILAAVSVYEAEKAESFLKLPKSWAAAVLVAATGLFIAALIPLSRILSGKITSFDTPVIPENPIHLEPVKTQISAWILQLYSVIAETQITVYLQRIASLAVEPVQIPMLSFSVPAYYFAALALLSVSAWYSMRESSDYGYSTSSYSA